MLQGSGVVPPLQRDAQRLRWNARVVGRRGGWGVLPWQKEECASQLIRVTANVGGHALIDTRTAPVISQC